MSAEFTYSDHRKLIEAFAGRVSRRLFAAGARAVTFEDIVQELSVAWTIARERWNPEAGIPFVPYLRRGMINHINRWAQHEIGFAHLAPMSLDFATEEGEGQFHEIVPATDTAQDDLLAGKQHREKMLKRLSPGARQVLEILESPPESVVNEFRALRAKSEYGRSRGIPVIAPKHMTLRLVMDVLGLSTCDRKAVYEEFKKLSALSQKVNQ